MSFQNYSLHKKIGDYRKAVILAVTCTLFCAAAFYVFSAEAAGPLINLSKLNFYYQNDGAIKIELVADNPVENSQIKRYSDKAIVQIKGVTSKLHSSYLVRNAYDVQVQTEIKDFDGQSGVEIVINIPFGADVKAVKELNKIYFLVSFQNVELQTGKRLQVSKTKKVPVVNFEPITESKNSGIASSTNFASSQKISSSLQTKEILSKELMTPTKASAVNAQKNLEVSYKQIKEGNGSIKGQIKDELGGVIVGAEVVLTNENGQKLTVQTSEDGTYQFSNLAPGKYVLKVNAANFAQYESEKIKIFNKPHAAFDIALKVNSLETQVVTVGGESSLNSDLENNANGIVLRGEELNSLPEDPQGLSMALQGLSAAHGSPLGGEIVVDGFSGGRIPPKKAIREIRINKNPYSAEFNRPGNGRIEILTKPGMEEFNGGGFVGFNNNWLNTRDPFAATNEPYQSNNYGFYLGGPVKPKKATFFFNFEKGKTDSNSLINATVLDPNFNIVPLNASVAAPQRYMNFTPRIDVQLDEKNTLIGRYSYSNSSAENSGVGGFSLLSRAFKTSGTEHSIQFTETAVLNPRMVTETRSQYVQRVNRRQSDNFGLSINVPGAFTSGSSFQKALNEYNRLDASNVTTLSLTKHTIRAGVGLRYVGITDFSSQNFGGTYRFDGSLAPQLNGNNIVYDSNGKPLMTAISGLERYRRTLLFSQIGRTAEEIRALGGGASQFTVASGDEEAKVSQYGLNAFVQDDWRIRPNFTLGLGMRFESQSNINKKLSFAPRLSFAWSKNSKTSGNQGEKVNFVLRGGIGFFYDGFSENYTLRANRLNGLNQRQFIVTDANILNLFPQVPDESLLSGFSSVPVIVRINPDLQAPLSIQSNISFEKQLPWKLVLSTSYLNVRAVHALRSRFINSSESNIPNRIFQYESTGKFNQNQLSFTLTKRLSNLSFYATYSLNKAQGDTDGADFIPLSSSGFETDYGRASTDVRHNFYLGGWIRTFYGIDINPLIIYRSGVPYNITIGRDLNGDTILNDRPAFATDLNRPSVVLTPLGAFDLDPTAGQEIIPRNYGTSPDFLSANLNISKTFTFFNETDSGAANSRMSLAGLSMPRRTVYLTVSLQIENLFNRTNPYLPEGNLSSPLFGRSTYSAGAYGFGASSLGNRVIRPYLTLSF
jgi:hypothetical protein